VERDSKRFCSLHDPEKAKAASAARSAKWDAEYSVRDAERGVMAAAGEVYKSQIGAGWEMAQQREAVQKLVRAYGSLEAARKTFRELPKR